MDSGFSGDASETNSPSTPTRAELEALRAALTQLFRTALGSVRREGRDPWQYREVQVIERGDRPGSYRGESRMQRVANLPFLLAPSYAGQERLADLRRVIQSVPRFAAIFLRDAPLSSPDEVQTTLYNNLLNSFAERLVARLSPTLEWDDDAFDETSGELESYLQRDYDRVVLTATLNHLMMDQDRLDLLPGRWIDRLPWVERQAKFEELSANPSFYGTNIFEVAEVEFVFRSEHLLPRGRGHWSAVNQGQQLVGRIVGALRLLAPGALASRMQWWTVTEPRFTLGVMGTQRSLRWDVRGPTLQLCVESDTATKINQLTDLLANHAADQGLEVALRRFEFAYDRILAADRMVDYWIGLEALFTNEDEVSETTDKLARRIARLLGEAQEERRTMHRAIKTLYATRSKLVHGVQPSAERVIRDTEESGTLLRRSISSRLTSRWDVQYIENLMMQ